MTCQKLSSLLAEHSLESLPAELRAQAEAHLKECPSCRSLVETIEGIQHMPVPQTLFMPEDLAPVKPMPAAALFVALALTFPLVTAIVANLWKGAFGWEKMSTSSAILVLGMATAGFAALGLGFYRQFKPGARDSIHGLAALGVLTAGYLAYAFVEFAWHPDEGGFMMGAARCLMFGSTVALATSLALLMWSKQGFAANPKSASLWTAGLASMAGVFALALHCPNFELAHVLTGHLTVIVGASFVITFIARRLFGLR